MDPKRTRAALFALLPVVITLVAVTTAKAEAPPILWQQYAHPGGAEGVAYSSDGSMIASGGDGDAGTVEVLRASDGSPLGTIEVGGGGIRSVDFNPEGDIVAAGTLVNGYPPGGITEVRRVSDGSLLFTLGGCFVDISPNGTAVAGGGGGVNRYISVESLPGGQGIASFYHGAYISDIAWTPDGSLLASSGSNNEVRLWNVEQETLIRTFAPHDNDVSSIAFSPDGTLLAAGEGGWDESAGSAIRIWRVADGQLVRILDGHGVWVYDVAFSPDGQTILSSGRDNNNPLRLSIRAWRVSDGALLEEYDDEVSGGVLSVAFAPDGEAFAYARGDGTVLAASYEAAPASIGEPGAVSARASLLTPVPNPLREASGIRFSLSETGPVGLTVHDATGRRVALLVEESFGTGNHQVFWNGKDGEGRDVAGGVYFVRLAAQGTKMVQRIVVIR